MAQMIVVLNDGETYSDIKGCSIVIIHDEAARLLGTEISDPRDIPNEWIIAEIALKDATLKPW